MPHMTTAEPTMVASTPPLEITKLKIEIAIDNIPYHLIAHAQVSYCT